MGTGRAATRGQVEKFRPSRGRDTGSTAQSGHSGLIVKSDGEPRPLLANALWTVRHSPQFQGLLGFNEFTLEATLKCPPPWEKDRGAWSNRAWTDNDDRLLAERLQHEGIFVNDKVAGHAADVVAHEQAPPDRRP